MSTATMAEDRMRDAGMIGAARPVPREDACSCGCAEAHVIMNRETADGRVLSIWSDGAITHRRMGAYLRGLGAPRAQWSRSRRRRAVLLVADDLARFDEADVPALVKIAERAMAGEWKSDDHRRAWTLAVARRVVAS